MTDAEHHQQELEHQEQAESKVRQWKRYGNAYRSHIHSDEDTVFVNLETGSMNFTIFLSKKVARQLANDLLDNSQGA
jgi:hypothetical protein